jgi:hypothetical protein
VIDRRRLALLGMMGSDFDGEVLNATRTAHKLLCEAKASWPEILAAGPSNVEHLRDLAAELAIENERLRAENERLKFPAPAPRGDIARLLAHRRCCLNQWERDFLASLAEKSGVLSAKQSAALGRIKNKISRCRRVA